MVSLRPDQEKMLPREVRKPHADFLLNKQQHGKYWALRVCGSFKLSWAPVAAPSSLFIESSLFLALEACLGAVRELRSCPC